MPVDPRSVRAAPRRRSSRILLLVLGAAAVVAVAWRGSSPQKPPLWQLLEKIAAAKGFTADFEVVAADVASAVPTQPLRGRLKRVERGLAEPWSLPELARELRDPLAASVASKARTDLAPLVDHAAAWLDLDVEALKSDEELAPLDRSLHSLAEPNLVEIDLLQALSLFLTQCEDQLRSATSALTDEERQLLFHGAPEFCEAWYRQHFPKGEIAQEQLAAFSRYQKVVQKVDRKRLLAVARRVAALAQPAFLDTLHKRLAKTPRDKQKLEGFAGDVIASVATSDAGAAAHGRVVLLGPGKSTIGGEAALVIDLGGDDTWQRAAVAAADSCLASVAIDLDGDDLYQGDAPGPAYAAGGVALLVDARGKDFYASRRLGQSASAAGFAALVDLQGDDKYTAEDYAQGYTLDGVALLVDREGKDVYNAFAYAQAACSGPGFAALVDGGGDDRYVADLHWPDVYGDSGPESYHGASQGWSNGFRGDNSSAVLPGGVAAFVDVDGKDFYQSGNFSQGGGYFFGFGLMFDGGGDDENHGYRYSQGFGVHQAIGMRWDAGGNDKYSTKCAANCGAAWDEGVGYLVDESGDDQYDVGGLALGGAAQTAIAVLLDGAGNDRYGGGGGADSQAGTGGSEYHHKPALGALVDLGGGKDVYARKDRGDDRALVSDKYGIFVDAKERKIEGLLDSKVLDKLLVPVKPPKPAKQ